ncbi:hypothetical protein OWV82_018325 [Melia azedarach]|uniref:Uncharacterized protein n=1 Tax=Melia azedarach TaxID=155640 RepID=A0ACC1XAP8_MELAZ|nr:hypothetical protein OWV82_018325 [Melia azedarach]
MHHQVSRNAIQMYCEHARGRQQEKAAFTLVYSRCVAVSAALRPVSVAAPKSSIIPLMIEMYIIHKRTAVIIACLLSFFLVEVHNNM